MSIKNFYITLKNQKIFEKKLLSQNLYEKYYIRAQDLEKGVLIDNFSTILPYVSRKKRNIGSSISINRFIFSHRLNKKLKLNSFLLLKLYNFQITKRLYTILQIFLKENTDDFKKYLIYIKPKKGGFKVWSLGVRGFLPYSHNIFMCVRLINVIPNKKKRATSLATASFFIVKKSTWSKYLSFKVPFFRCKMRLIVRKRIRFTHVRSRKRRLRKKYLKFLFLGVNTDVIIAQYEHAKKKRGELEQTQKGQFWKKFPTETKIED